MIVRSKPVHLASWTDPRRASLRMLRGHGGYALLLVALGGLAFRWDCALSQFALNHPLRGDLRRLVSLSECFGYGLSAALIIVTATVLDRRGWAVGWRLVGTTFGAGLASNCAKILVARQRPSAADLNASSMATFQGWCPPLFNHAEWGYGLQSFPSSHTATAVGLAIGLSTMYPRGRWLFFTFAAMAGLQRITSSAHFASDVFFGAALACVVSGWLVNTQAYRHPGLDRDP